MLKSSENCFSVLGLYSSSLLLNFLEIQNMLISALPLTGATALGTLYISVP